MRSLTENIQQAITDFNNIKQAIIDKGGIVPNGAKTSEYANCIRNINITTLDYSEPLNWLNIGGIDISEIDENISFEDILEGELFNQLLLSEGGAAYAAFCSEILAYTIKHTPELLAKVLSSSYKEWFINSSRNFLEFINDLTETNPIITSENSNLVTCSSEESNYLAKYAFDGSIDSNSATYNERHIWVAYGGNQWIQYEFETPRRFYCADIYSVKDNAPTHVTVLGANGDNPTDEDFVEIDSKELNGIIGLNSYDTIACPTSTAYKFYRFVIRNSVRDEELSSQIKICTVGEIIIHTFRES